MSPLTINEMRVNGRPCPLGVDSTAPALAWSFAECSEKSKLQTAYRILVSTRPEELGSERGEVWDSGIVNSGKCADIRYAGAPLESRRRYFWQVTVWDENNGPSQSAVAWWEMGLLSAGDWKAQWIGEPDRDPSGGSLPMPQFRREFDVAKPLSSARAYISGLGHYELRLNGAKVGDHVLDPGWTDYDTTCLYTVHDITDLLKVGRNAAGFILGNGFYHVAGGRYTKFKDSYGMPKCRLQIELRYTDGTAELVATDRSWKACGSPIVFSCTYGGEDYDARLEQPGWDEPGFEADADWFGAAEVEAPGGALKAQTAPPLKVMKRFEAKEVTAPKPGVYVLDLGQNFSGWVKLAVSGPTGAEVTLTPGERLTEGLPDQKFTGSPYKFTYTLKGNGREEWSPRFSYYGFRYVQVEGAVPEAFAAANPQMPVLLSLEGQMIYPDTETVGGFHTSDPMINRIHEIIDWAILSNMKSVFTDCPHREKLGWLEELHLMGPSIIYNYDVQAQLTKIMDDMRDAQLPSGMIPTTAPEYVVFEAPWDMFRHSVPWGGAYVLVGWEMFRKYGDKGILDNHYEDMKRYVDYLTNSSDSFIVNKGLGDWYDVGPNGPGFAQNTPVPLVETAFYYHLLDIMQQIAAQLGRTADQGRFRELGKKVKRKFNDTFFDRELGCYSSGSQAAQAIPLAFGLVEELHREAVFGCLTEDIITRGHHTTAGDVGHRYVLLALAMFGRSDLIYNMAVGTDDPSYGYQIVHGATSLTEAWDGPTVGKSQNHFMLGHIEEWFYGGLAGINYRYDSQSERFLLEIKPYIPADMQKVEAWHVLPAGKVRVTWERQENGILALNVTIPPNTKADVYVPASSKASVKELEMTNGDKRHAEFVRFANGTAVFRVGSGDYHFTSGESVEDEPGNLFDAL